MLPLRQFQCWSHCAPPHLSELLSMLPLKQFRSPFVILLRKIINYCLFLHLSPPGDCRCDVLGFVPSSSTHRSSEMQDPWDSCFSHQSICSIISLDAGMCRTIHSEVFNGGYWTLRHASLGCPLHFSFFVACNHLTHMQTHSHTNITYDGCVRTGK